MKVFFNIFLVCSFLAFRAQNTVIPDPNFEQALIDIGHDSGPIDGVVPTSNIQSIINLNVSNKNISDLSGIEDFTNLALLNCSNNLINHLDLNLNTNLTLVNCNDNQLVCMSVKNGNNSSIMSFNSLNNLNLYCIEVDDVTYAFNNWNGVDNHSQFQNDCNYQSCSLSSSNLNFMDFKLISRNNQIEIISNHEIFDLHGEVMDVRGKTISKFTNNVIDINVLEVGIYFVVFTTNNSKYSFKFFKSNS